MFKMNTFAVICEHVETRELCLLATAPSEEDAEIVMAQNRAGFTQIAALPQLDTEQYEAMMATIRSLRIIPVRVTEIAEVGN